MISMSSHNDQIVLMQINKYLLYNFKYNIHKEISEIKADELIFINDELILIIY